MRTITLNKETFPFGVTPEGERLLSALQVDMEAVKCGDAEETKRYAYCIAAGAAKEENKPFDFTIEQFIHACPLVWKQLATDVLNDTIKPLKPRKATIETKD